MEKKDLTSKLSILESKADEYIQLSKEERASFIADVDDYVNFLSELMENISFMQRLEFEDEELDKVPGAIIKYSDLVIKFRAYEYNNNLVNVQIENSFANASPVSINEKAFSERVVSILADYFKCQLSSGGDCAMVTIPESKSPIEVIKESQALLENHKEELFLLARS